MVDDLLAYTRTVNGVTDEPNHEMSVVDLGATLSAAIGNVRAAIEDSGVQITHTSTVRDTGIGLNMAYSGVIFEAFKRLHGPETPGSGVGLAICKNIIESFGDRIWVDSDGPDQGAAFHFTLPAGLNEPFHPEPQDSR